MVIWIIGLSGAGKSVIGATLYKLMKQENPATVLVDGDQIREMFRHNRGNDPYSVVGRRQNAERICEMCLWLDRQGIDVVCCILSIFEESREWNRANLSRYFEVFIEAPMDVLADRNPQDLYNRARAGEIKNVVGVDIPFETPKQPDLIIENGADFVDPDLAARRILEAARQTVS